MQESARVTDGQTYHESLTNVVEAFARFSSSVLQESLYSRRRSSRSGRVRTDEGRVRCGAGGCCSQGLPSGVASGQSSGGLV